MVVLSSQTLTVEFWAAHSAAAATNTLSSAIAGWIRLLMKLIRYLSEAA